MFVKYFKFKLRMGLKTCTWTPLLYIDYVVFPKQQLKYFALVITAYIRPELPGSS